MSTPRDALRQIVAHGQNLRLRALAVSRRLVLHSLSVFGRPAEATKHPDGGAGDQSSGIWELEEAKVCFKSHSSEGLFQVSAAYLS